MTRTVSPAGAAGVTIRAVVATFIVYDELDRCPYLAGHVARLPLRVPARPLTRSEVDAALAAGDRRQGVFLYRPACPACQACEPIRIPVGEFQPSATHRRTLRAGDARFRLEIGKPVADEERAALYARHKWGRGLTTAEDNEEITDVETYAAFLVETCCESLEFALWDGDRLVAVAVADRGDQSLSAVYCCFDPEYARFSPGTYTILKQWEYCQAEQLPHLYLGLFVADSTHLSYKASFSPHERRIDGTWHRFTR
ncbi:MAG: arginyltransferase [Acidobacteria bacterium]|nr:arginyltransferase [Acidobacteriota bacterium]